VLAIKEQIYCNLNEESVILNLSDGTYYGLDEIGTRIWGLIQEPRGVSEIINLLLEEYNVERDRCEHDVLALLCDLGSKGLIEIVYEETK
jgi:hypothetical protein